MFKVKIRVFFLKVSKIRVRVRVEHDGPCICMYVLNIIRNFILYIGLTYMYVFCIIFCMVLSHDYIPNFCMKMLIMYLFHFKICFDVFSM
jgi:hypothetical protein